MSHKIKKTDIIKNFQKLLDSIGDGILIVNNKGIIIEANDSASEILGFTEKDLVGRLILKPLGAIDEKGNIINKKNAALFNSIRNGKKTSNALRQWTKKNGERFWTAITTTPIKNKRGIVKGGIVVFRDITEQKEQEEYRTEFAHVASHDLRTPLGNVQWAIEYLLSGKLGKLNDKQNEYLQETYETLKRMNRLVNDLLSISRIQNKKTKARFEKIPIEKIIKKVIADIQAYAKAENVRIKVTTDTKNFHYVKADLNHLRTIIQNLIENAVRYSFDKSIIEIKINRKKDGVLFSCTNKGIGIPKGKENFIFAKFYRAPNAIQKQGDGTGLGLYITSELVKLNKGKIWFESELNKETTFHVKFKSK